jgi:hypothetical protein
MKKFRIIFAAISLAMLVGCGSQAEDTATEPQSEQSEANTQQADSGTAQVADTAVQPNAVGNSTSNYSNNAIATSYGEYCYFVSKDNGKKGIYRIGSTGTTELVAETTGQDLTTIDGTVYYLSGGSIYKTAMRENPTVVKEDGTITDMCATNNWIYYIKKDDKGLGKVYKMMFNGSGETMVTPKSSTADNITSITLANSYLYFTDPSGVGYMSLDGQNKTYLLSGYQVSDYGVYGEYLYYVYQGQVYRIKAGSASELVQCTGASNVTKINIVGDVMYIISDAGIGTVATAGGTVSPISAEKPASISVCGGYIFGIKGNYFYRMRTNGTDAVSFTS